MRTLSCPPLDENEYERIDSFWRAANYLAVGQLYLRANPLFREPLQAEHVKPRLLGHWGTVPGLTLVYAHLNRLVRQRDLDMLFVAGPGHGGAGVQAASWLEGTFSQAYPAVERDEHGMARLFNDFAFPGGMPSHVGPEVPGSINEGGELGYSLSHAYGAAFDNPGLVVGCVVADGEAETGPLATSWHSTKFLDPVRDGAVLPILHLNRYKITNPTVLSRIGDEELTALLEGFGHTPYLVEGDDPATVHRMLAATLDRAVDEIGEIQHAARHGGHRQRPRWPVVVVRTPKGWTGPEQLGGRQVAGTWRSHQIPLPDPAGDPDQRSALRDWLHSYRPEQLFDEHGGPSSTVTAAIPSEPRRMSANAHANGGTAGPLNLPEVEEYAVTVEQRGGGVCSPTAVLGEYLRDVLRGSDHQRNFRLFSPDELDSNKLGAVYDATDRAWQAELDPVDADLAPGGRVMEVLSEYTLQGWLEGYLLSSHVWQQDHNGFSHQDPGFLDHVTQKKPDIVRGYLPADANTLLCVADHCLRSQDLVNVIVAGKQTQPSWLDMDEAHAHATRGAGTWEWAGIGQGDPDVVMACAGDVPTRETLAAVDLLRTHLPDLAVRVVNVVDLMRLQSPGQHPHGLPDVEFEALFTADKPILFAYHGYPWLIHRLTHDRTNRDLHVRGYREEGSTTTPFDMAVRNGIDRFGLVIDVVDHVAGLGQRAVGTRQAMIDKRTAHDLHTRRYGQDLPEVRDWSWSG